MPTLSVIPSDKFTCFQDLRKMGFTREFLNRNSGDGLPLEKKIKKRKAFYRCKNICLDL